MRGTTKRNCPSRFRTEKTPSKNKKIKVAASRISATNLRRSSSTFCSNSRPTDEDSGFGNDLSFDTLCSSSSSSSSSPSLELKKESLSPSSLFQQHVLTRENVKIESNYSTTTTLHFLPFQVSSRHQLPVSLAVPIRKKSEEIIAKQIRLDMNEEANELPEDKTPVEKCQGKQTSFKNVPELMMPSCNQILLPKKEFSLETLLQQHPIKPQQCVLPIVQTLGQTTRIERPKKKSRSLLNNCHPLEGNIPSTSSDGSVELQLLSQPEEQHRARYQTEGSRGAVKDREGQGHPSVKLAGYYENVTLQVFVASDLGVVSPHICYQACKVSGKNSTPCEENKVSGTVVLEINMLPDAEMTVSCDCVGILKERNVDVENKIKREVSIGRKKSIKCRLVFRTQVTLCSGVTETLQVVSEPINCTQPPGVPEINRKSRSSASVEGGEELFIIGKNYLKDTQVIFQEKCSLEESPDWSIQVTPEKEFLHNTHLICQVPEYLDTSIERCVDVDVLVFSNGKTSDPQTFTYVPRSKPEHGVKDSSLDLMKRQNIPKGVSPTALELNRMYTASENMDLIKNPEKFIGNLTANSFSKKDLTFVTLESLKVNSNPPLTTVKKQITLPVSGTASIYTVANEKSAKISNEPMDCDNVMKMLDIFKSMPEGLKVSTIHLLYQLGKHIKGIPVPPVPLSVQSSSAPVVECFSNFTASKRNLDAVEIQKSKIQPNSVISQSNPVTSAQVLPYAIISPQLQQAKKQAVSHQQGIQYGGRESIEQIAYPNHQLSLSNRNVVNDIKYTTTNQQALNMNSNGQDLYHQQELRNQQAMINYDNQGLLPSFSSVSRKTYNQNSMDYHSHQSLPTISTIQNNTQNNLSRMNLQQQQSNSSTSVLSGSSQQQNLTNSHNTPSSAAIESHSTASMGSIDDCYTDPNAILYSQNSNFEPSTVLQLENCDPLLSQANTPNQLVIQQNTSQNSNSNYTVTVSGEETPMSQYTETDLMNFINPTIFDV